MRFTALLFLLFTLIPTAYADNGNPALHRLFADEWDRSMRESPEYASYYGDLRFNDRWADLSLKAIADSEAADRAAMARLHAIDRKILSDLVREVTARTVSATVLVSESTPPNPV